MTQNSDIEKLRFLIPHWIEHNLEHANEFRTWASKVRIAHKDILKAAEHLEKASRALEAGLEKLGGPLDEASHSHES
jgi:DNA-directed RNA polymerase subunit L